VHAGLNRKGVQRTLRLSREWRRQFDTAVGPYSVEFTEPMKEIRLRLGDNPARLKWDLRWLAVAPPTCRVIISPPIADAGSRIRRATTRLAVWRLGRDRRSANHDRSRGLARDPRPSWGVYEGRPPLAPDPRWLPPARFRQCAEPCAFRCSF